MGEGLRHTPNDMNGLHAQSYFRAYQASRLIVAEGQINASMDPLCLESVRTALFSCQRPAAIRAARKHYRVSHIAQPADVQY
jgi:hypothetical protein